MFFYVSLVLVIVAAVTLVVGLLSSGLALVIVSIAASFLAGVFLILTVLRDRPTAEVPAVAPAPPVDAEPPPPPAPSEVEFPIADYDDLRVSEIVPLLPELDDDELELVREAEEAGKGRATILNRIDELLAEPAEDEEPWSDEEFPIADYDDLRVSDIVPLLPELDDDELDLVYEREEAGKARATILNRIDEILGGEEEGEAPTVAAPAPAKAPAKKAAKKAPAKKAASKSAGAFPIANYDDLTVGDVAKRLKKLDADELKAVRTYEKRNKSRKGVLDKVDAELAAR